MMKRPVWQSGTQSSLMQHVIARSVSSSACGIYVLVWLGVNDRRWPTWSVASATITSTGEGDHRRLANVSRLCHLASVAIRRYACIPCAVAVACYRSTELADYYPVRDDSEVTRNT